MGRVLVIVALALVVSGCLYRPDLQQGNTVTQEQLDKLHAGLSKSEVQAIMGTPALTPVFKLNQWNYNYAFLDGQHRDQPLRFKTLSLFFKEGKLDCYSSKNTAWRPRDLSACSARSNRN